MNAFHQNRLSQKDGRLDEIKNTFYNRGEAIDTLEKMVVGSMMEKNTTENRRELK